MTGGAPSAPDGPTGRVATWVADLDLETVPAAVTARARHLLLDGIGCAMIPGLTAGVVEEERARRVEDAVLSLDSAADAGDLLALLGPTARSPFDATSL